MKKVIFLIMLIIFVSQIKTAYADTTCTPNMIPTINGTRDFILEIGQAKPDYLEGVFATDSCGNTLTNILVSDDAVHYDEGGEYTLYYYSLETVWTVNVYIYEDIPLIEGTKDFTAEINSSEIDYLADITATDVLNDKQDITSQIIVDSSLVDYTQVGEYPITYTVTDSSLNTTVKTVQVVVQDTIEPTITNCKNLVLEVHTDIEAYDFWENIEVTDNSLLAVTKSMNLDNLTIDTVGEYEIEYVAVDEEQNTRRVPIKLKVLDTTKPEIKNAHDLEILVNENIDKSVLIQGITIEDNYDVIIPNDKLVVDYHFVNTSKPGIYPVFYFVSDSSGNYSYQTINLRVHDTDVPIISNIKNFSVEVNTEAIDYLENITCLDLTDGDLIGNMIVYSDLVDLTKIGTYPIMYMVSDSSGNLVIEKAQVVVYDTEKPVISGVVDLVFEVHTPFTDEAFLDNVSAYDNNDKDLSNLIEIDFSQVNANVLGTYQIKYSVEDSSHNKEEIYANVTIVDETPPVITGYHDVTIIKNQTFDTSLLLQELSILDNYDGNITENAEISGFYDSSIAGTYPLSIDVTDSSGNKTSITFNLIVIEEETDTPTNTNKSDYSIYYIMGGIGVSLVLTGFLGYRTRRIR